MRLPTLLLSLVVATAGLLPAAPAACKDKDQEKREKKQAKQQAQEEAIAALRRGEILPISRILAIATAKVPGDVIEVEFKGGPVYEVEILQANGRVREVVLDARTGEVLRVEDD